MVAFQKANTYPAVAQCSLRKHRHKIAYCRCTMSFQRKEIFKALPLLYGYVIAWWKYVNTFMCLFLVLLVYLYSFVNGYTICKNKLTIVAIRYITEDLAYIIYVYMEILGERYYSPLPPLILSWPQGWGFNYHLH